MDPKDIKPTFGVTKVETAGPNTPERAEIGAIWEKISKSNNRFLTIKLNIPKKVLQELLAKSTTDTIETGFIAFPNRSYNGDSRRPTFRIFEDQKK